jgi:hypothetical protein
VNDRQYFNKQMDALASAVQKKVDSALKEFAGLAGNKLFKAEVLGPYDEASKGSWRMSKMARMSHEPLDQMIAVKLGLKA